MLDKYVLFRQLMDFLADHGDVVDADMNTWDQGMMVKAKTADETITIEVTIVKKKEESEDA